MTDTAIDRFRKAADDLAKAADDLAKAARNREIGGAYNDADTLDKLTSRVKDIRSHVDRWQPPRYQEPA